MQHTVADVMAAVVDNSDPGSRWGALTTGLQALGLDQINYAFLDFATYDRMDARGDPAMSTMRGDWLQYYADQRYDMQDEVVAHVRAGRFDPRFYRLDSAHDFRRRVMAEEAMQAGLKAGLLVPLPGPWGDAAPAAGIVLGSSLKAAEVARLTSELAPDLIALSHILHAGMTGDLLRRRWGLSPLSPRERDVLQLSGRGLRVCQIADRLTLAEVTVQLYLRNARRRLKARTLAEAVAKAIILQQIEP